MTMQYTSILLQVYGAVMKLLSTVTIEREYYTRHRVLTAYLFFIRMVCETSKRTLITVQPPLLALIMHYSFYYA